MGEISFTQSPHDILNSPEVDVVFVAAATGHHFSMAMAALEHGKHVWCEKPLTTSLGHTEQVLARAKEMALVSLETDMFLHHPLHRSLREILAAGTLGDVRSIAARFGFPHLDPTNFRYSSESGGGALLDAGFYPIAAFVDLLGPDLQLVGAKLEFQRGFEVDTGGSALVVGRESAVGSADWGFGRSYRNEIEVWAERGYVHVGRAFSKPESVATRIEITLADGEKSTIETPGTDHFTLMVDAFSDITASPGRFNATAIHARASLIEAIRKSG